MINRRCDELIRVTLCDGQYLILEKPVMRIMKTLMQPPKKRKKPTSDHTEIDSKQQDPEEARTEERDHTIKDSS